MSTDFDHADSDSDVTLPDETIKIKLGFLQR